LQPKAVKVGVVWTPDRKELLRLLAELHPDPAQLYSQAINFLSPEPLTRPNLSLASHCIRELPGCLAAVQLLPRPKRVDANTATSELHEAWVDAGLSFERPPEGADVPKVHSVPNAIFDTARTAAAAGAEANRNALRMIALVTTGQDTDLSAAPIRRVHLSVKAFTRWCHWPDPIRSSTDLPPVEKVEAELAVIEQALLTRHANRGDRVLDVRALLASANKLEEDDQ
jgi:hypothetical protein